MWDSSDLKALTYTNWTDTAFVSRRWLPWLLSQGLLWGSTVLFVLHLFGWRWVLGSARGPDHSLGVWHSPIEKDDGSCGKQTLVFSSAISAGPCGALYRPHNPLCSSLFVFLLFICLWCTRLLEEADSQAVIQLAFHCTDTWKDYPQVLWKPLSVWFSFPEHRRRVPWIRQPRSGRSWSCRRRSGSH